MKASAIALAFSTLGLAAPAGAQAFSYDRGYTNACFDAASMRDTTGDGVFQCNLALLRETTNGGDGRAANLVNRGILFLVANNLPAAGRDFDQALAVDASQPEALLGKAIERWQAGNDSDAVSLATRSLERGPQRPAVAYLVRGLAHERLGQVAAAYNDLTTARRLEPSWSEPAIQLQRYRVVNR